MENSNSPKQDIHGVVLGQKIVKFRFSRENSTRFEAYPAQWPPLIFGESDSKVGCKELSCRTFLKMHISWDFPGGPVVKTVPSNEWGKCLIDFLGS